MIGSQSLTYGATRTAATKPSTTDGRLAIISTVGLTVRRSFGCMNSLEKTAPSTAMGAAISIATIVAYTSKNFHGLISVIGLVLAFFFLAAVGGLRVYHGLTGDGATGPGGGFRSPASAGAHERKTNIAVVFMVVLSSQEDQYSKLSHASAPTGEVRIVPRSFPVETL